MSLEERRVVTRLSTPIDFDADGKQCDFIRLPHSVHRSAYGYLPIPLVCIKNGDGPTVLLMSGNHGDEYEGQVTLVREKHDPRSGKTRFEFEVEYRQLRILPWINK